MRALLATAGLLGVMVIANWLGETFATAIIILFFVAIFTTLTALIIKVGKNANR